jgi:transcriptional regulator with XRE-family HTH domain
MNKKLKEARLARGWTIKQIAGYLEVGETTYKGWQAGRHQPDRHGLRKLCHLLKKTPEELGLKGDPGEA